MHLLKDVPIFFVAKQVMITAKNWSFLPFLLFGLYRIADQKISELQLYQSHSE